MSKNSTYDRSNGSLILFCLALFELAANINAAAMKLGRFVVRHSLQASSPGRSGGDGAEKKKGELATMPLEFEFHLQFPCGSPSTELSDFRQSTRSRNERECKRTLKTTCQG